MIKIHLKSAIDLMVSIINTMPPVHRAVDNTVITRCDRWHDRCADDYLVYSLIMVTFTCQGSVPFEGGDTLVAACVLTSTRSSSFTVVWCGVIIIIINHMVDTSKAPLIMLSPWCVWYG